MYRTRSRLLLALDGPHRGPARRDDAGGTGTSTGSGSTEGGASGDSQGDTGAQDDSTKPNIDGDLDNEKKAKAAAKAADERVAAGRQRRSVAVAREVPTRVIACGGRRRGHPSAQP
ncbi:hypothetical protein ACQEVZ_28645 [Dactylosporangium sp. CA-152071]|uniref:hypothetical protein n=1 Tax=Dactylosporangium sp. CA-152071 TaxID=3239933 RepID=UPI003D8CABB3